MPTAPLKFLPNTREVPHLPVCILLLPSKWLHTLKKEQNQDKDKEKLHSRIFAPLTAELIEIREKLNEIELSNWLTSPAFIV
jgi:hypothetical protein